MKGIESFLLSSVIVILLVCHGGIAMVRGAKGWGRMERGDERDCTPFCVAEDSGGPEKNGGSSVNSRVVDHGRQS